MFGSEPNLKIVVKLEFPPYNVGTLKLPIFMWFCDAIIQA